MILLNEARKWTDSHGEQGFFREELLHLDISGEAKILYMYLSNKDHGDLLSNKELLKLLNCEIKKLHRTEKELIKIDLLIIEQKISIRGKMEYHLTVFDLEN